MTLRGGAIQWVYMGKIDYDQKTGAFEITYGGRESPFMGIDSSAPDPYIGPNQLTQNSVNALVNNNTLLATFFQQLFFLPVNKIIIGFGDLLGQIFVVMIDSLSTVWVAGFPEWPSTTGFYYIAEIPTSAIFGAVLNLNAQQNTLTYKNINGVCYFSFTGCPLIFQHNNQTGAVLTTYLGCSYLSEINGRLIAADVWQAAVTPPTGYTPTSQDTGVQALASNGGTQNETSAAINSFPNQAVSAGYLANVNVTFGGVFNCNPQNNVNNVASLEFQISVNSGTSWTTFYTWQSSSENETLTSQQITIPNVAVTNLDQIQLRIIASATAASGGSSYISTITGMISACSASIATSSTAVVVTNYPFQYAWSAATGQYSQFNPTTTDSNGNVIDTGAGYNNLPDVEDVITGLFNTGPTQFILRTQGITEVTALSNGINPFEFDHLWASHKGIGTVYPQTVGQYGSLGAFFSDTGIFTFGYDGINEISGKALSAIYNDLILTCQGNLLTGGLGPTFINGETYLSYILAAVNPSNNVIYAWLWNGKTNEWYRFQQQLPEACFGLQVIGVNLGTVSQTQENSVYIAALVDSGFEAYLIALPINGNTATGVSLGLSVIPTNMIFPAEEIKFDRDATINGIGVYYNCTSPGSGELVGAFSISGTSFEELAVSNANVTFDGTWRYVLLSPPSSGGMAYTGKAPQLSITAAITDASGQVSSKFQLGKIVLIGSVDISQEIGNE